MNATAILAIVTGHIGHVAALTVISVGLFALAAVAQTAREVRGATPRVAIPNEAPPKLIVDPPIPEQLALGRIFIQYRTKNLRILPLFGSAALVVSPRAVVAGHKRAGRADDPKIIDETRVYIPDFDRIAESSGTADELYEQMLCLYPDRVNPGSLWSSARAEKG
jgi:hypothetical protein